MNPYSEEARRVKNLFYDVGSGVWGCSEELTVGRVFEEDVCFYGLGVVGQGNSGFEEPETGGEDETGVVVLGPGGGDVAFCAG